MSMTAGDARLGDWLQTRSGKAYWPMDPRPEDVDLRDIAHGLSMICRFGGHTKFFYSVAEHSVLVSECVPEEHALAALLHDATEAYVGDMVRPLKQNMLLYQNIEDLNWQAISKHFGLPYDMHPCIKEADNAVLLAEKEVLLDEPPIPWTWAQGLEPAPVKVWGLSPTAAKRAFLQRFNELTL